jgi:arylsulfatase A-like enzyme
LTTKEWPEMKKRNYLRAGLLGVGIAILLYGAAYLWASHPGPLLSNSGKESGIEPISIPAVVDVELKQLKKNARYDAERENRYNAGKIPNIILISIDTLSGLYFTPEHMPKTYGWAEKNAIIFKNAFTNCSWTKPSHLTMLTGLLPHEHKVELSRSLIPKDLEMVQHELKGAGYKTIALVESYYLNKSFGFGRGFDSYLRLSSVGLEGDKKLEGTMFEAAGELFQQLETAEYFDPPYMIFLHSNIIHGYRTQAKGTEPEAYRKAYADCVRRCDNKLAALLNLICDRSSLSEHLRVIVTSDHGELLCENFGGELRHGHDHPAYPPLARIPLFLYGESTGMNENLIGLENVRDTILFFAGIRKSDDHTLLHADMETLKAEFRPFEKGEDHTKRYVASYDSKGNLIQMEVEDVIERPDKALLDSSRDHIEKIKSLGYLVD